MGRCSDMVYDGVDQSLQLLDPAFSKVLMLIQSVLAIIYRSSQGLTYK